MDKANLTDKRIHSFDVMRIIASCAVVLLHISVDYVKSCPKESLGFITNNLLSSLTCFGVPVFFMISGALMLDEDKELSNRKIVHSALLFFVLLMFWNIFYSAALYIVKPLIFKEEISAYSAAYAVFNGHFHMWYLYVLIGLYLKIPVLRTFIKRDNLYLISVYLNFSVLVCFAAPFANQIMNLFTVHDNLLTGFISRFRMCYFYDYIVYYIMGWYITMLKLEKAVV